MWKGFKEFFTYTKKQRNGIFVLIAVILLLWLFLLFDQNFYKTTTYDFSDFKKEVQAWQRQDSIYNWQKNQFTPFYFNPNKASDSVLLALNLSPKQVSTILNYRAKGGVFRKPEDLKRIYGIDSFWYAKVASFIKIPENQDDFKAVHKNRYHFNFFDPNTVLKSALIAFGLRDWQAKNIISYREKVKPYKNPMQLYDVYGLDSVLVEKLLPFVKIDSTSIKTPEAVKVVLVDINTADSLSLIKVKGIGKTFAKRIVNYREKLGGFYKLEQLKEVYGIGEEAYKAMEPQLKISDIDVKRLNINTASFKELLAHPYLEYEVVKNIVSFRERQRPFKSIEELKNIELVDDELFSKIAKYLTIE